MIPLLIPLIGSIIDKIFPDKESADRARLELIKLEAEGAFRQIEINKAEAANGSVFVAGARPFIIWVCGIIFAYTYLIQPIVIFIMVAQGYPIPELPKLDNSEVMTVLMGLLGLGGLRTIEKIKGVARHKL